MQDQTFFLSPVQTINSRDPKLRKNVDRLSCPPPPLNALKTFGRQIKQTKMKNAISKHVMKNWLDTRSPIFFRPQTLRLQGIRGKDVSLRTIIQDLTNLSNVSTILAIER
jgi:hypothetical protein